MTNRLELSWKLDGFVDEQRYYCSLNPIDINSPPTPKAILANDLRTYTDSDITAGQTYYVRIGSVKNEIEKLSDEVQVTASNIDPNYRVKLLTQNGILVDNGYSELSWSQVGVVAYNQENELEFNQGSYLKSLQTFAFNSGFEFDFEFYIQSNVNDNYFGLIKNTETVWGGGGFQISVGGNNVGYESNKLFCGFYGSGSIASNIDISRDTWHKAKINLLNGEYTMYLDNVLVASASSKPQLNNGLLIIGSSMSSGASKIRNFKSK